MADPPEQKSGLNVLAARALLRYMRLVQSTSRITLEPADAYERMLAHHPFILAIWHGQFLMMPLLHTGAFGVSAMELSHGDGGPLSEVLGACGIDLVKGSGAAERPQDRGGVHALRSALRALEGGSTLAVTADVPGTTPRRAGRGIVLLARRSGRPIVPVAVASSRYLSLDTWSRFTLNLPFSSLVYAVGEPIWVPHDARKKEAVERYRLMVEQALDRITERAYKCAGADPARAMPRRITPFESPAPLGLGLRAYRRGTSLLRSAAPLLLKVRERRGKEDPTRLGERYGKASAARPAGAVIWLHAASVGETNAVLPLMDQLMRRRDELAFVLTTGTVTSARLAAQRLGPRAVHQFVPLDVPEYARAFLDHWRPDLVAFTESEIWPNLILETSARNVPLALVNGRMSGRSFARWRRSAGVSRQLFSRFDIVLAQNEKLAQSFADLGARKVITVGNLKTDAPPPPVDARELERLRAALKGRPVLVAASTHEGEEGIVAHAHRRLAREVPGVCTIIAPRHPERGTAIAELLKGMGCSVGLRSLGQLPCERTDIYIADTIGELGTLYALAPVAFVGGSLVERGGQNPIEPIGHGVAVLTGPHGWNFRDVYRALLQRKGAQEVENAEELAAAAAALITSEAELQRMRAGAKVALASLSGALERTAEALAALVPPSREGGVRRAS
jgi:3-deoxy-D-manno-octulosonic-acid transferase